MFTVFVQWLMRWGRPLGDWLYVLVGIQFGIGLTKGSIHSLISGGMLLVLLRVKRRIRELTAAEVSDPCVSPADASRDVG